MKKILFGLSGSIACFKACAVISKLVQNNFTVQTVVTPSALQFIGAATLEGLTGRAPLSAVYQSGQAMEHIYLERWADLMILCPATANMINKLAHGGADDLWSTLSLAHDFQKPYLIAPAMNPAMLKHPATLASLAQLQEWGLKMIEGSSGATACGENGWGRMAEPDMIYQQIVQHLGLGHSSKAMRILITSGGTREPIDAVRSITNSSTGATGAVIADYLASRGHEVTCLHGRSAIRPREAQVRCESFESYNDLDHLLQRELGEHEFTAVIHAAAVSDYSVERVRGADDQVWSAADLVGHKLGSGQERLVVELKRNHKLLTRLKGFSKNPNFVLVGFKLTHTPEPSQRASLARQLAEQKGVDFVVLNDSSEITPAGHPAWIYAGQDVIAQTQTKLDLAERLEQLLQERL